MQLQVLGLSSNQLTGTLPQAWSNLTNVRSASVIKLTYWCVLVAPWSAAMLIAIKFDNHSSLALGQSSSLSKLGP